MAPDYNDENGHSSLSTHKESDTAAAADADGEAAKPRERTRNANTPHNHDDGTDGNIRESHGPCIKRRRFSNEQDLLPSPKCFKPNENTPCIPSALPSSVPMTVFSSKAPNDIPTKALVTVRQHYGMNDSFLEDTPRSNLPSTKSSENSGQHYGEINARDQSIVIAGNIFGGIRFNECQRRDEIRTFGLCLGQAPQINPSDFIGRAAEIDKMSQVLQPGHQSTQQRRLVLGGVGGIGKTQIAIAYAQRHKHCYESGFWLNATSKLTLQTSFRLVARKFLKPQDVENLDDEQILTRVHEWLSDTRNSQWLLIFDNYDDPNQFDIGEYCPYASHGSIIITTRLPNRVSGQQVRVQPLSNIEESLKILQTRSGRDNVSNDINARRLAERLGGLPLALATAGAYLHNSTFTFQQYLHEYERRWNIDPRRPLQLQDYQSRTLFTTWDLSFDQLETDDPNAAKMLKQLAYFDNQNIRYELFRTDFTNLPEWLQEITAEAANFESVMRTLVEYCLVEVQTVAQSYSMHSCVHDWTLAGLNKVIVAERYWYALDCIAPSINKDDWGSLGRLHYAHLTRHALRLVHDRFQQYNLFHSITLDRIDGVFYIAELLAQQVQLAAAERMYMRALAGYEKALGPEHISTLDTVNNLGLLYSNQGKLDEAEQMYIRALVGTEKALGPEHTSTLTTVNNLGLLYSNQGKLDEAEQMHIRALVGKEKALGPEHTSTLNTVNNLGSLYSKQGKLDEAEQMYIRALAGYEKVLGPEHTSTLTTVNNLGSLYSDQGKLDEAEQMYIRALAGYEKALGPEHTSTLDTIHNLGCLYSKQGKLDKAGQMFKRSRNRRVKK